MNEGPPLGAQRLVGSPGPPLVAMLAMALDSVERRHLDLLAASGFDDVRRAHNAVLARLPDAGLRLTDLAADAGMSKQAMAELVDDLVAKGYIAKTPDPDDGRAKRIVWADRGRRAHASTLEAFAAIDAEVASALGDRSLDDLRAMLGASIAATADPSGPDTPPS